MHIDDNDINAVAVRMLADYDAGEPGTIYAEGFRLDLSDAWRLQTAVTRLRERRGEQVIGYKIGCVDPGNRERMGLPHPVWGRLWATEQHFDGAVLEKSKYTNLSIEAEFGIVLSRNIFPGMSIDDIANSVSAVYPLLELHNLVMRGNAPNGHELVGNNCIHCGVVRGAPVTELLGPRQTALELIFDGKVVDSWDSLNWPDDVLEAVEWLAAKLATNNIALKEGDFILTGAWGPPIPVLENSSVELRSSSFGNVTATFN